jgi:hypothetical protein
VRAVRDGQCGGFGDTVNVNIRLNTTNYPSTTEERAPYENIIKYFADAVYESSNGVHKLGTVTFYPPSTSIDQIDIKWFDTCHPESIPGGIVLKGGSLIMCNVFEYECGEFIGRHDFISEQMQGGNTLGHEWGHYFYGLYDEYQARLCDLGDYLIPPYYQPWIIDEPVKDSIMNRQSNAVDPSTYSWLNFSIKKNHTPWKTAQWRVYEASAWDTLTRPISEDPPHYFLRFVYPERKYYPELGAVKPGENEDARIDLTGEARSGLKFRWIEAAPTISTLGLSYEALLNSLSGNNISYPNPILLLASVQKDSLITDVNVQGSVRLPDGSTKSLIFKDDGVAPDVQQGDGLYSAILGYEENGVYTIQVDFDNNAGTAKYVHAAFLGAQPPDGFAPMPEPTPVNENFTASKTIQVSVSNVVADDHGNTPDEASVLIADNKPVSGKIDYADDKDLFKVATLDSGITYVRVFSLALGMNPHVRVIGSDKSTVLYETNFNPSLGDYLFIAVKNVLPGTTVYVEVSDISSTATGGLYEISSGKGYNSELVSYVFPWPMFLPAITNTSQD